MLPNLDTLTWQWIPLMRFNVVHDHKCCGWREGMTKGECHDEGSHPSLRPYGRNLLGNRKQRKTMDKLNMKFNIHITDSIILSDLCYISTRRYQKGC